MLLLLVLAGIGLLWLSTRHEVGATNEFLGLLGSVLLPAALVTFLFELFVRTTVLAEVRSELALSVRNELGVWWKMERPGFAAVHPSFPIQYVTENISKARHRVLILANWLPDPIQLEKSLASAINNGADVQVILLDPESPHARDRGRDLESIDTQIVAKEIRASIGELARFSQDARAVKMIDLRLHGRLPTHILFAWDETVLFSTYLLGVHALQASFLEFVVRPSGIAAELIANFEKLRTSARPIALSD